MPYEYDAEHEHERVTDLTRRAQRVARHPTEPATIEHPSRPTEPQDHDERHGSSHSFEDKRRDNGERERRDNANSRHARERFADPWAGTSVREPSGQHHRRQPREHSRKGGVAHRRVVLDQAIEGADTYEQVQDDRHNTVGTDRGFAHDFKRPLARTCAQCVTGIGQGVDVQRPREQHTRHYRESGAEHGGYDMRQRLRGQTDGTPDQQPYEWEPRHRPDEIVAVGLRVCANGHPGEKAHAGRE